MSVRTASCRCGNLRVECRGEPVRVSVCHCFECQKRSGSAFATQARWRDVDLSVSGEFRIWERIADSGHLVTYRFCPSCGSTMAYAIEGWPGVTAVPVGNFADPDFPPPGYSVYEHRQHPWVAISGQVEHSATPSAARDPGRHFGERKRQTMKDDELKRHMAAAIEEARQGLAEGGIPIGSVLAVGGKLVGRGHNRRVQRGSAVLHAEMDCLENAGRLTAADYRRSVLFSTLSPCDMCSGAILLYGIPHVVIGENRTFKGPEDHLRSRGVRLDLLDDAGCYELMQDFVQKKPALWKEDIGE